jgi:hypothetical protein
MHCNTTILKDNGNPFQARLLVRVDPRTSSSLLRHSQLNDANLSKNFSFYLNHGILVLGFP